MLGEGMKHKIRDHCNLPYRCPKSEETARIGRERGRRVGEPDVAANLYFLPCSCLGLGLTRPASVLQTGALALVRGSSTADIYDPGCCSHRSRQCTSLDKSLSQCTLLFAQSPLAKALTLSSRCDLVHSTTAETLAQAQSTTRRDLQ